MSTYLKGYLQQRLKEEGLPHAYKTLRKYEEKEIIKRPENRGTTWRMYSEEEINDTIQRIREHVKK